MLTHRVWMFACIPIELGLNIGCVGNSSVIIQQLSHMRGGGLFTPLETLLPTQVCAGAPWNTRTWGGKKEGNCTSLIFICVLVDARTSVKDGVVGTSATEIGQSQSEITNSNAQSDRSSSPSRTTGSRKRRVFRVPQFERIALRLDQRFSAGRGRSWTAEVIRRLGQTAADAVTHVIDIRFADDFRVHSKGQCFACIGQNTWQTAWRLAAGQQQQQRWEREQHCNGRFGWLPKNHTPAKEIAAFGTWIQRSFLKQNNNLIFKFYFVHFYFCGLYTHSQGPMKKTPVSSWIYIQCEIAYWC
jgi:hypothetical protein